MPYNSPMKKKGSSCMQMKDHKGKTTGLMMEGSAMHMSMLHQESAKQEKKDLMKDMPVDDKASAMEMSPYKMDHEGSAMKMGHESPAKFTGMSGGSALHTNHPENIDPKTGKRVDEFGTPIPDNLDVSVTDADALSRSRLDKERRINEALDLAEGINQGEVKLNLGNISTDYPSASQYIVGTGTGPEGVISQGGGTTQYTTTGVTNRINELREKMTEPGGVESVFDELSTRIRYGANKLGDAKLDFQNIVDPLGIRSKLGYTNKRKQYVQPGKTIYERMQANKNKS